MTAAAPGVFEGSKAVFRREGVLGTLRSAWDVLKAKRQLRAAQEVGWVRLGGSAVVRNSGTMRFGDRVRLNGRIVPLQFTCHRGGYLEIGDSTFINYGADIAASWAVKIGKRCNIGQFAIIIDDDYHDVDDHTAHGKVAPVIIEDDVWLGARVTVLRGSRIGRGSVVAAHAVVMGEIPPYSLAAGVPAKVVRRLRGGEAAGEAAADLPLDS